MALLCINRMALPDVLSYIKDYNLISIERKLIMDIHKKINYIVMDCGNKFYEYDDY